MQYSEMNKAQLQSEQEQVLREYNIFKARNLDLDMSRGKPSEGQIQAVLGLLDALNSKTPYKTESGINTLNYGCPDGLPECKALFADILGVDASKIFVGGNSSLNLMFDYILQCYALGASETSGPWSLQGEIKFLCPCPGYDRHFGIAEYLGIKMIPVKMTETGPDMDQVEELVRDHSVKGMFCVPKYSNPTGITYSDETVKRLAAMKTADDFRIIWDNAYCIHDLFGREDTLLDILTECEKAGNPNRAVEFASTSKISLSGAGVSVLAANAENLAYIKKRCAKQTIGHDKANQLRHVLYYKDINGVKAHMKALSDIISPRFEVVLNAFDKELGALGIACWSKPNGGYFISLDVLEGCATRVYNLCKEAGVKLTNVGATYPYGKDPLDTNIRIAPTFPSIEELSTATELLVISIKLAAIEKYLETAK
ncbi:MAG: aminotransferase class I/II-fold pyridoxal phosphate-dependent enzyme [Oscillospiraceae bacterium]|nr:aminotransferase class I/II-fold pyridoxal phosphate-dependent enzyme [Candidatus Limimonas egerieequi]